MTKNNTPNTVNTKDDRFKSQPKTGTPSSTKPQGQSSELTEDDLDKVAGGGCKFNHNEILVPAR